MCVLVCGNVCCTSVWLLRSFSNGKDENIRKRINCNFIFLERNLYFLDAKFTFLGTKFYFLTS